jgi:hypothetical protein
MWIKSEVSGRGRGCARSGCVWQPKAEYRWLSSIVRPVILFQRAETRAFTQLSSQEVTMKEHPTNGGSWMQDDVYHKYRLAYGLRNLCTIPPPFSGNVGEELLCRSEMKQRQYGRQEKVAEVCFNTTRIGRATDQTGQPIRPGNRSDRATDQTGQPIN